MTRNTPRPRLRRRAPLVVAAGAALTLVAAPAFAAVTTTVNGTAVTITGDGTSPVQLSCTGGGGPLVVGAAAQSVRCDALTALTINLASGPENLTFLGVTTFSALPYVTINSADTSTDPAVATDTITGSSIADIVTADRFDTVNTGADQDQITGGLTTDGGAGNDRFINHAFGGSITGGDGTDAVDYDFTAQPSTVASFTVTPTTVQSTVNGVGASTSVSGVEQYYFSTPDGSAQADVSTIDGRGQGTRIVARMHSGIDTFYGGTGNDVVDLGPGTDAADPGAGNDTVQGGEGDDTISVRDNEVDVVDCGDGTDTVTADRVDVLKNCENVNLPPLPPPAPTPAPETGGVVGLKKLPRGAKASFVFVSPTAGVSFQCRVDSKNWKTCRSPYKLRTNNLSVGKHKFFVRALLSGNNVDASPSTFGFTIQKPKPRKRR